MLKIPPQCNADVAGTKIFERFEKTTVLKTKWKNQILNATSLNLDDILTHEEFTSLFPGMKPENQNSTISNIKTTLDPKAKQIINTFGPAGVSLTHLGQMLDATDTELLHSSSKTFAHFTSQTTWLTVILTLIVGAIIASVYLHIIPYFFVCWKIISCQKLRNKRKSKFVYNYSQAKTDTQPIPEGQERIKLDHF